MARAEDDASGASSALIEGLTTTGSEAGFGENTLSIYTLIGNVINIVLGFLGILILLYLIWAGWTYATSHGEKDKVEKAKKMISTSVIGAILIVAAYAMASYILSALTTVVSGA
jgi:heme/copper-type cytochrome/quinol oxidase subunit 2